MPNHGALEIPYDTNWEATDPIVRHEKLTKKTPKTALFGHEMQFWLDYRNYWPETLFQKE